MVNILLADDQEVVRQDVKRILMEEFDPAIIDETSTIAETLHQVRTRKWDIVVLDITMHGRSGVEVLNEIKKANLKLPVLIFSMHPEEVLGMPMLKAGAAGYLTKGCAATDLVTAIRKVLGGGRYMSPSLTELLAINAQRNFEESLHQALPNDNMKSGV